MLQRPPGDKGFLPISTLISFRYFILSGNADGFHDRLNLTFRFLESHQEAEERVLFPLVLKLEEDLFLSLKKEHQAMFHRSDIIVSPTSLNDSENLSTLLSNLRSNLIDHFFEEETSVFSEVEKSLSVSQIDILRIKFATRHPVAV